MIRDICKLALFCRVWNTKSRFFLSRMVTSLFIYFFEITSRDNFRGSRKGLVFFVTIRDIMFCLLPAILGHNATFTGKMHCWRQICFRGWGLWASSFVDVLNFDWQYPGTVRNNVTFLSLKSWHFLYSSVKTTPNTARFLSGCPSVLVDVFIFACQYPGTIRHKYQPSRFAKTSRRFCHDSWHFVLFVRNDPNYVVTHFLGECTACQKCVLCAGNVSVISCGRL